MQKTTQKRQAQGKGKQSSTTTAAKKVAGKVVKNPRVQQVAKAAGKGAWQGAKGGLKGGLKGAAKVC